MHQLRAVCELTGVIESHMLNRRRFLACSFVAGASACLRNPLALAAEPQPFTPWIPGTLDIHHIATNRGNSTLMIQPDGTTLLVDAGALYAHTPYLVSTLPSEERRPGEWIGRYAKRHLSRAGLPNRIDAFMLTHHHDDHMGAVPPGVAKNRQGFVPTGVSDVDAIVPISRFVDRDPSFSYPAAAVEGYNAGPQENYKAFLKSKGAAVEKFRPGANEQFALRHDAAKYPGFEVRNLAANGEVWTGEGTATRKTFPDITTLRMTEYPSENCCSAAIRVRYGNFSYYTGGDLPNGVPTGQPAWWNIETAVAKVCGKVSVALLNHHGYYDADGPEWVSMLQPRIFIIEAWDSAHPTVNTMQTLMSTNLYPGPRDVFATFLNENNRLANKGTEKMLSRAGHIVVRVSPGGSTYTIFVLSNKDETDTPSGTFGPYTA